MPATWDPAKAAANLKKHGLYFGDAELALYDPVAITRADLAAHDEQRYVTIGADALGRILVATYTYRGDTIRLISARKATSKERRQYEEGV